jgi:hypothetical protein
MHGADVRTPAAAAPGGIGVPVDVALLGNQGGEYDDLVAYPQLAKVL